MIKSLKHKINSFRRISFKNLNLPITRTNEGLNANQNYLDSAIEQVDHLMALNLLNSECRILDFGCGQGRFVNGLMYSNTKFSSYLGIDTDLNSINWCKRFLSIYSTKFQFLHLASYNARYNEKAIGLKNIPGNKEQIDLVFLNSVFSHMVKKDVEFYLNEFYSLLNENGRIYLTAFVETDVPPVEENPPNYISSSTGHLHRVRYEKKYFFDMLEKSGFIIEHFFHQHIERAKQSVIIIKKNDKINPC